MERGEMIIYDYMVKGTGMVVRVKVEGNGAG